MGFLGNALTTDRGHVGGGGVVDQTPYMAVGGNLDSLASAERSSGDATAAAMRPVTDAMVGNEMGLSNAATQAAGRSFSDYQTMMGKVNQDATNYDSPEQMERVRQEAAGSANSAWDTAMADRNLGLEHMGVNPNSARFADPNATSLARTGAVAGSMNAATAGRNKEAIGLRYQAAGLSGNAASTFSGLGLTAARTAVDTGVAGNNAALPWDVASGQALATRAGLNSNMYSGAVRDAGQSLDYNLGGQRIVSGQISGGLNSMFGGSAFSSKTVKTDRRKIDEEAVLAGLMRIPVEAWRYKKGVSDEGEHVGPYAEDVHREFGDRVAPKGKVIDLVSMHGIALAGLRALATKVAGLEKVVRA